MKAGYPRISASTACLALVTLLSATGCPGTDPQPDTGTDVVDAQSEVAPDTADSGIDGSETTDGDAGLDGDSNDTAETTDAPDGSDLSETTDDTDADTADTDADTADTDTDTADTDTDTADTDTDTDTDADLPDTDTDTDGEIGPDADVLPDTEVDGADAEVEVDAGCLTDEQCAELNTNSCATSTCNHGTGECVETPLADGIACEDGNLCSTGETCTAGACVGGTAISCSDTNPCTDDLCKPSVGCTFTVNFSQCDDGDPCTLNDACLGGECLSGALKCDDDNPCTADNCSATGECDFPPTDAVSCDDGSECTGGDVCSAGACVATDPSACDDANPCTANTCSEDGTTCETASLSGSPCDDGDVCTLDDTCVGSNCNAGAKDPCDDGNDCTSAACDSVAGCAYEITADGPCDDGNACTSGDACDAGGSCVPGDPTVCDDDNVCTADSCDPSTGCVNANLDDPCPDGDACTTNEMCVDGACQVEAVECDDDDMCTDDQCDAVVGCQYIDTAASCDDGEMCTDDSCDPALGCVSTPNTAVCDDGDSCTDTDACAEGVCVGVALDCDDDDACTLDVCTVEEGCVNAPFLGACDDGDACTETEACDADGLCDDGTAVDVDDGFACTLDACDTVDGVTHTPDDDMCNTGRVCDAEAGCVWGDVVLLVERVMLDPTADDDSVDGQGQWLVVRNIGTQSADLADFVVTNGSGATAAILDEEGTASLVLEPGVAVALVKAPETLPADVPSGAAGVFGVFGDGFSWLDNGDTIGIQSSDATLTEEVSFENIATAGDVSATQMPVLVGRFTDLSASAALQAAMDADSAGNDAQSNWCVATSSDPLAPATDCGRVVVNEVSMAGAAGARWVEIWAAPGAPMDGLLLRLIAPDGSVVGLAPVAGGRMPVDSLVLAEDGVGGATLPLLTDGSVQLLQDSLLVDVVGYGALVAAVDGQLGLAMFETAPGVAPMSTEALGRTSGGADTDDNAADFSVQPGTPGASNP